MAKKPCEKLRGGASVQKASASDVRPQAQNRATGDECECSLTQGAWWVRQPFVTKTGLGSEPTQRRIQSRFGRADQFPGVTKLCRRNGAANWAQCSGGGVRSRGCFGASQFSGLLNQKFSWPEIWRGGRVDFDATERAHKRNGGQVDAECRRRSLVTTTPQMTSNGTKWKKANKNERF